MIKGSRKPALMKHIHPCCFLCVSCLFQKSSYRWLKSGLAQPEGADAGPTATDEEMMQAMEDWMNWKTDGWSIQILLMVCSISACHKTIKITRLKCLIF